MILSRDQILAAQDQKFEEVPVPEWGGAVRVGTMSGTQRDAFEASLLTDGKPDARNARAKLAAACIVDENGAQIFSIADLEALGAKSSAPLTRIVDAARRLNRIGEDELEVVRGN